MFANRRGHAAYEFRGNAYRSLIELDDWTKLGHEEALEPDLPILGPHHHVWDHKKSCGYGVLWNALKRITQGCSAAEKAALYHDTAARVYQLAV